MRIAVVAGEVSGDLLGAGLMRAMAARRPDVTFEGIAGPEMLAAGCKGLYPMERLSVMGLIESFGRYPELIPLRGRLARRFIADPPDAFVGIDAPDFNLSLERRLRAAGIPTVHYVSPSVWAWRRYRIRKIERSVDLMLTLFPFEAEFYREHGVPVRFVGHPLADIIPERVDRSEARASLGVPADGEIVALLPGSRMSEVEYLAEPLLGTARWLHERRPGLRFLVPLVNPAVRERFEQALAAVDGGLDMVLRDGESRSVMAAADAVLLASGTASLEAMLLKRPMVITYRTTEITFRVMAYLIGKNVRFAGLPNLLAGREVVPELMQDKAIPEVLGPPILGYLERPEAAAALADEFDRLHRDLRRGASERVAEAVLETARGSSR